jgi:hypothetical protein
MTADKWQELTTVHDEISAQALVESLRASNVPAKFHADTALLGVARTCRVFVPAATIHRARLALGVERVSDEELEALALSAPAARDEAER